MTSRSHPAALMLGIVGAFVAHPAANAGTVDHATSDSSPIVRSVC